MYPQVDSIMEKLRAIGVKKLGVNGTEPDDWGRVADLADRFPEVIPFFGLHPWKVNDAEAGWSERLQEFLERFPEAGVGEVGLDKWIRDHDIDRQKDVFEKQIAMAREKNRPLAVHCLQAWGHLHDCIEQGSVGDLTLLHSFGGPVEMVDDFTDLGVRFSISGYFFRPEKAEKLKVFEEVPDDRLLIETDAPDMMPPQEWDLVECSEDTNHPANIFLIYKAVAEWRGEPEEKVTDRVAKNFDAWCHTASARDTASARSESE